MTYVPSDPTEYPMPEWFRATVEYHKQQQRALNAQRKADGLPSTYGKTITRSVDHRP